MALGGDDESDSQANESEREHGEDDSHSLKSPARLPQTPDQLSRCTVPVAWGWPNVRPGALYQLFGRQLGPIRHSERPSSILVPPPNSWIVSLMTRPKNRSVISSADRWSLLRRP